MTRLSWGDTGTRFFEAGVDRGVLYIDDNPGIPWNGLQSVREAPSGGTGTDYHLDGIKYLHITSVEEFDATIQAFGAPEEFAVCDGTANLYAGLYATQQPRKPFNFSYRTKRGNDVDDLDYGYKIHLVYNAIASPSSQSNESLSDSISPINFSWAISTVPIYFPGLKPTSHFIIDSVKSGPLLMEALEDFIYGTDVSLSNIPTPEELTNLFSDYGHLRIKDLGFGNYSAEGYPVVIDGPATFQIDDPSVVDNNDQSFTITY